MKIVLEHHQTLHKLIIYWNDFSEIFYPETYLRNFSARGDRELLFLFSTNCIGSLFSIRGERWKISIHSRCIQKRSNSYAQWSWNKTEQNKEEAIVFWGSIVKTKHQKLTNLAFM